MNRLNDEQRQHWEDQGYLHLKNIVPRDEIATCLNTVDQLLEQHEHDNPATIAEYLNTIRSLDSVSGVYFAKLGIDIHRQQ